MVFCNKSGDLTKDESKIVTILILIDGFLQSMKKTWHKGEKMSHNPYFNRWFSAIGISQSKTETMYIVTILILIDGFLQ